VINIENIAKAIEADVGDPPPDLLHALEEAKARVGRVMTSESKRNQQGTMLRITLRSARSASLFSAAVDALTSVFGRMIR
jgi:hypothetical protein